MRIEYERANEPNPLSPAELFACALFVLGIFLIVFGCPLIGAIMGGL